jgi:hypothetical protein
MAVKVASTDTLAGFPEGTVITVAQENGNSHTYTKNAEGRWQAEGLPAVRSSAFAAAIQRGQVGTDAGYAVGDWLLDENRNRYAKVIRQCHGKSTYVVLDRNRVLIGIETEFTGVLRPHATNPMPATWNQAADNYRVGAAQSLAQERLDQILDSGVIPEVTELTATVVVEGTHIVQPTDDQARMLLGDEAEIRNAEQTRVDWSKEFQIDKESRWDCVCDQVTQADINALEVPGTVTKWTVTGCR